MTILRPYQQDALDQIRAHYAAGRRKVLLHLATGGGKCHAPGTMILTYKGPNPIAVEDIKPGTRLLGPDSKPRTVVAITQGIDHMFEIVPKKGASFKCNLNHQLVLWHSSHKKVFVMAVKEFLALNERSKSYFYIMRFKWDHEWRYDPLIDPWLAGFFLAQADHDRMEFTHPAAQLRDHLSNQMKGCMDGLIIKPDTQIYDSLSSLRGSAPKADFIIAREAIKAKFLSGFIDGTGILKNRDILLKFKNDYIKAAIKKIALSLGFQFDEMTNIKYASISGELWELPIRRTDLKITPVRTWDQFSQFSVKPLGPGDYFGFTLKQDPYFLLHDGTVSHNTVIFSEVLKGVHERKKKAIMVVRGKQLVDQASQRLFREKVPHGVLMAGHWNRRPHENIQVCSIDTLRARALVPEAQLVVIDEAHYAASPSFRWLIEQYPPETFFLPVTATPHVPQGLRHVADEVVYPITISDLIKQNYLVPPKYFSMPSETDFEKLKIDKKTGDFYTNQIDGIMGEAKIVGDIVKTWLEKGENRPTICFATSVANSIGMVDQFIAAGIPAVHIEAKNSWDERQKALKDLETGVVKIVSNVGILCTGVDMPYVSCVIMARPTASYNLMIQQLGRATRIYPGKSNFIVLDHGKNVVRHGFIEMEKECDLDGSGKKEKVEALIQYETCKQCYYVYEKPADECPQCGFVNPKKEREAPIHRTDIDLVEIKDVEILNAQRVKSKVKSLINRAIIFGYQPGWVYHRIKTEFGATHAKREWDTIKSAIDAAARQPSAPDSIGFEST
jgi:superfamily II DNA or RNA helicase